MATFYIDPLGNDATGDGSINYPWRNLLKACNTTTSGDIIHVNAGTFPVTASCNLRVGVSIVGEGDTSIISSTLGGTSYSSFAIVLESGSQNTNGNQSISYIKLDGNNYTAFGAIKVAYRGNVQVHHCTVVNFNYYGVSFVNGEPPTTYATLNRFYNNTVTNCSIYATGSRGNLEIQGQDGMWIYNNTMTIDRGPSVNTGDVIYGVEGFLKNVKIYSNTLSKTFYPGLSSWDFAIELWNLYEGNEIYNNIITGGVDICRAWGKGTGSYCVWMHDNAIGQPSQTVSESTRGFALEHNIEDTIIERNYIRNTCQGIGMNTQYGPPSEVAVDVKNLRISYNVFHNIGVADGGANSKGWGLLWGAGDGDHVLTTTIDNIQVLNNVFVGNSGARTCMWGIELPDSGIATNVVIRNNIVTNFDYAPVYCRQTSLQVATITNLWIENNIFYGNGNSNVPRYAGALTPVNNSTTGNLISNPLFVSTTLPDYHLQATSPAINAGLNVSLGATLDMGGAVISTPPEIGAYEFAALTGPPVVTTTTITAITQTTATGGGNVTSANGGTVSARGVVWSTSINPTTALTTKTSNGTGTGVFTSSLTGLTANTLYYVRAYATNEYGTSYGNNVSFTTLTIPPVIVVPSVGTATATSITSTTAVSGGTINSDGGATITARGVCYSTSANPTTANSIVAGSGTIWTSNLTGLTPATTYYVRAYATNSAGTGYGGQITFVTATAITAPTVTTTAVTNITTTTADSGGTVTSTGGGTMTARGIVWSTTPNPTITSYLGMHVNGQDLGSYTGNITSATPGTTYYVRAFATNNVGTSYGAQIVFTTLGLTLPTITTTSVSSITQTSVSTGGNVTSSGGSTVTARGVVWATTSGPTTAVNLGSAVVGSGTGVFTYSITGLTGNTVYYVRAYAINSTGTAYGNEIVFTTSPVVPTVIINTVSNVTQTTTTVLSNLTSTGGSTVTARGVAWGTSPNPTVAGSHSTDTGLAQSFTTTITGLSTSTTYYVRAYATNAVGTSYSPQNNFTTDAATPSWITLGPTPHHFETQQRLNYGALYNWYAAAYSNDVQIDQDYGLLYNWYVNYSKDYGVLYNWYAATYSTGGESIAPAGWHVPTTAEFDTLVATLGGNTVVGGKLKEVGTEHWTIGGSNTSGFTAIGSGERNYITGNFEQLNGYAWFHVSDVYSGSQGLILNVNDTSTKFLSTGAEGMGMSIRLIKDNSTDPGTMTDYDGNVYPTVKIGSQVWMASNLKVETYNGGTPIPYINANEDWIIDTAGGLCYYDNDVNLARSIAPAGWHVPSLTEIQALQTYVGGEELGGGPLKETGTTHWADPNTGATNSTGFTALGSGCRLDKLNGGSFYGYLSQTSFWGTTSEYSEEFEEIIGSVGMVSSFDSAFIVGYFFNASYGSPIRLIKDNSVDPGTMTDIDSNVYQTVKIGDQVWMAENLRVTHYNDGSDITYIADNTDWGNYTDGAYCYYTLPYTIAPDGWHVPTDVEWETLYTTTQALYGGTPYVGIHLREDGTEHWQSDLYDHNSAGLTIVGNGYTVGPPTFYDLKGSGYILSADSTSPTQCANVRFGDNGQFDIGTTWAKTWGAAIRLIKDDDVDPGRVTDIDGNIYDTVKIGDQVWLADNFKATHFNDGVDIPLDTNGTTWSAAAVAKTPVMVYFNFDISNS